MLNGLPVIPTEVFTRMPQKFRDRSLRRPGSAPRYHAVDGFLEGPSFDRNGNLYVVDVPYGRIFRIDPRGDWELVVHYDGEPNGLKIHRDGRIFVADFKHGIMVLDPARGSIAPLLEYRHTERFRGINDLVFATNGDLYFTDQGLSSLSDPTGRVYRYTAQGKLECLMDNAPSPNGIVLSPAEDMLYVAMTVQSAVWRMQPVNDGSARVRMLTQLTCGGTDGLATDTTGSVVIANAGIGIVWIVDKRGVPTHRIESCAGDMTTNIAFGGADRKTLYITESSSCSILTARMPEAGVPMYAHSI
jgi:gluconolactonase